MNKAAAPARRTIPSARDFIPLKSKVRAGTALFSQMSAKEIRQRPDETVWERASPPVRRAQRGNLQLHRSLQPRNGRLQVKFSLIHTHQKEGKRFYPCQSA